MFCHLIHLTGKRTTPPTLADRLSYLDELEMRAPARVPGPRVNLLLRTRLARAGAGGEVQRARPGATAACA